MSESKHTPGPWEVGFIDRSPRNIVAKGQGYAALAKVYLTDPNTKKRTPEYEGNLRLIAAAPELLEALENIMGAIDTPIGRLRLKTATSSYLTEAITIARAAITKAKGLPK